MPSSRGDVGTVKLGFIFTVTNHSVSCVHKSQSRESYSMQVIQSHRNPQSAQKPGSSGASPTSLLCFNQWLREKATSPAVCSASPPPLRLRTWTVTVTPSQKWHQLPGTELLGWAAQRIDKAYDADLLTSEKTDIHVSSDCYRTVD